MSVEPPAPLLTTADYVFTGKLVKVDYVDEAKQVPDVVFKDRKVPVPRRFLATLQVTRIWKGDIGREIVLHTREGSSDCVGFWTDVGKEYLVFAVEGVVTRPTPEQFVIPDWSDKLPVGQKIIAPGMCTLGDEVGRSRAVIKQLGRSKAPGIARGQ